MAAGIGAVLALTGCAAGKSKENVMEKETSAEVAAKIENIDLGSVIGVGKPAGSVQVCDLGDFRLHVYLTRDVMNDASYIVEGADSVVTMEQPLFKVNVGEFDSYLAKLGKPVAKRITDYHLGGTGDHGILMAKGMPEFVKGPVYGGMMKGFEQAFGDSITPLPTGSMEEADFDSAYVYAGIQFEFSHGASTDFPAASIIIGGKAYYTHWAPAKAHMSHMQLSSRQAVDAELAEARRSLDSGAVLFIGGHGGAVAKDAVEFKIAYLSKIKELLASETASEAFAAALDKAYPGLPGSENLGNLAAALCE